MTIQCAHYPCSLFSEEVLALRLAQDVGDGLWQIHACAYRVSGMQQKYYKCTVIMFTCIDW